MDESLNICLPCGLCCDGTLIGFVRLESEEVVKFKSTKEIEVIDGEGFFFQPCSDFCEKCTIYDQRPKKCASFNCGLLDSVQTNTTNLNEALQIIASVKHQKKTIEQKMESLVDEFKGKSFYFKTLELKKKLKQSYSEHQLTNEQLILLNELETLEKLIYSKFKLS
jgi:hypothetical protein